MRYINAPGRVLYIVQEDIRYRRHLSSCIKRRDYPQGIRTNNKQVIKLNHTRVDDINDTCTIDSFTSPVRQMLS